MQAKAEVVLLGIQVASNQGWHKVEVLSDAQLVVDAIAQPSSAPWEIRSIILNIIKLLSRFMKWECRWISKEMNNEVHVIGQIGQRSNVEGFCAFDHPLNVRDLGHF